MNYRHHIAALPDKGSYAAFMRALRTLPQDAVTIDPLSGWHRVSRTVAEIRRDARIALDRRINARAGNFKANEPIDIELVRDARDLDARLTQRVRVYQFRTDTMRARFGHLLARHDD